MDLLGFLSGLYLNFFFLFLKDMSFRYCVSTVNRFLDLPLRLLSLIVPGSWSFLRTRCTQYLFGILLVKNTILYKLFYLCVVICFWQTVSNKVWKIQLKFVSLLNCLLCLHNILFNIMSYFFLLLNDSWLSVKLLNKQNIPLKVVRYKDCTEKRAKDFWWTQSHLAANYKEMLKTFAQYCIDDG